MSPILVLNCWILGEDSQNAFEIKIPKSETVAGLKKAIANETKSTAAPHALDLWMVQVSE